MRIDVTWEDIADGAPHSCSRCPIALAIQRATGLQEVVVGLGAYKRSELGPWINLPSICTAFVRAFDDGCLGAVPFSFDLEEVPA